MFTAPSQVFNTTCFNMCVKGRGAGWGGGGEQHVFSKLIVAKKTMVVNSAVFEDCWESS